MAASVACRPGRSLLTQLRALIELPAGCKPGTILDLADTPPDGQPRKRYQVVVPDYSSSYLWVLLPSPKSAEEDEEYDPAPSWTASAPEWIKALAEDSAPQSASARSAWEFITAPGPTWTDAFGRTPKSELRAHVEALEGMGIALRVAHKGKKYGSGYCGLWLGTCRTVVVETKSALSHYREPVLLRCATATHDPMAGNGDGDDDDTGAAAGASTGAAAGAATGAAAGAAAGAATGVAAGAGGKQPGADSPAVELIGMWVCMPGSAFPDEQWEDAAEEVLRAARAAMYPGQIVKLMPVEASTYDDAGSQCYSVKFEMDPSWPVKVDIARKHLLALEDLTLSQLARVPHPIVMRELVRRKVTPSRKSKCLAKQLHEEIRAARNTLDGTLVCFPAT